jgi:hypothetical protein
MLVSAAIHKRSDVYLGTLLQCIVAQSQAIRSSYSAPLTSHIAARESKHIYCSFVEQCVALLGRLLNACRFTSNM